MQKTDRLLRWGMLILGEGITLATVISLLVERAGMGKLLLSLLTVALVLAPEAAERLLHCKLWSPLYVFTVLYALGPMLGHVCNFYYLYPGWDKLLHIAGGIEFAIVGIFLFRYLSRDASRQAVLTAVFALCFSMALSMAWEFYEFGVDRLLGTDTQADTYITQIHSHELADTMGGVGSLSSIESVAINGVEMPWPGYLDIGLIDTMMDMLLETLGAVAVALIFLLDRGKHPMVEAIGAEKHLE